MSIWAWLFRRHHHPIRLDLGEPPPSEDLRNAMAASQRTEHKVRALDYEVSLYRREEDHDRQSH